MHSGNRISRTLGQIAAAVVLVCVLSAAANAYTVVMRGGRRLEIPSSFMLTTSTLTYEVSPGVQVSLNLAAIDIAATEKANNELPGSLLRRAEIAPRETQPSATAQPAKRTITNQDLEASMRRRRESELAYERRRKELGLPSVEESRQKAAAESDLIAGELEQARASERESENYWRARATALRTEMAVLDEQQQEIRRQLDGSTFATSDGSILTGLGIVSLRSPECFGPARQPLQRRPNIFVAPHIGPQITGRAPFGGGSTRGQVLGNPWAFPRSRRFGSPAIAAPNVIVFGSAVQPFGLSDERNQLITEFNQLSVARAGLNASWRELEDEARRAGAPPGWLRP